MIEKVVVNQLVVFVKVGFEANFNFVKVSPVLEKLGAVLQKQPYDHVLRREERQPEAFAAVVEYIARNPERAGIVGPDKFREYPYTNCLLPGFPEVSLWQVDFWTRFDRIVSSLRWDGDALVGTWRIEIPNSEMTISFRYELEDGGRRLRASEQLRGGGRDQANVWVFERR